MIFVELLKGELGNHRFGPASTVFVTLILVFILVMVPSKPPKNIANGHGRWESKGPKTGCCPQDSIQLPDKWLNYGLWIFIVDIT